MPSTVAPGRAIHSPLLLSTPSRRRCDQIPLPFINAESPPHHPQGPKHKRHNGLEEIPTHSRTPRRTALLLLSLPALARPPSAAAISLGITGPKDWLRDQKKKVAKFVLAPIEASRQSVRNAYLLLDSLDSGSPMEDSGEVRRLLDSAERDCVPKDRSSLVSLQASTGVEVCTFRLILKNASSLLDDRDPMKLKAETLLGDLISSFSFTGGAIDDSDFQLISDRQKVKDGLLDTISALDKFEQGIKDCLGV